MYFSSLLVKNEHKTQSKYDKSASLLLIQYFLKNLFINSQIIKKQPQLMR